MSKTSIRTEYWAFPRYQRKLWLLPILVILLAFGLLLVTTQVSSFSPFFYSVF